MMQRAPHPPISPSALVFSEPAQQHLGRSFVPGGSVRPGNPPLVSYSQQAPPPRHPAPAQTYPVTQPPAPAPAPAPPVSWTIFIIADLFCTLTIHFHPVSLIL